MKIVLLAVCCFATTLRADVAADRADLAKECDALIARSVHRPYGSAWTTSTPDPKPKGGAQPVDLRPGFTPAAALALYWAGEQLGEPKYKDAAHQAARGLCAAQRPPGNVPAHPIFLPNIAGGPEQPALIADRAPTCAALALWLTFIEETADKDPAFHASSLRALNWLLHQQPATGLWLQSDPPATQPNDAVRIVRLDDGDWRNTTLTMLLARDVLHDLRFAKSAEKSNEFLLRLRVGEVSIKARHLWSTAYTLNATASDRFPEFPPGVDMLATRKAMDSLLASTLVLGDPTRTPDDERPTPRAALTDAAKDIVNLPKYEDRWLRRYDFDVDATHPPPPLTSIGFETAVRPRTPAQETNLWGLDQLLPKIADLQKSRDGLVHELNLEGLTLHQRLAATACGLTDRPFGPDDHPPTAADKTDAASMRIWQLILKIKLDESR